MRAVSCCLACRHAHAERGRTPATASPASGKADILPPPTISKSSSVEDLEGLILYFSDAKVQRSKMNKPAVQRLPCQRQDQLFPAALRDIYERIENHLQAVRDASAKASIDDINAIKQTGKQSGT